MPWSREHRKVTGKPSLQIPLLHYSILKIIERPWVIAENFLPELRRDILPHGERMDKLILARWVAVRIVRTDQQMIVTRIARDVRNILVGFTGDIEAIFAKHFCARCKAKFVFLQAPNDMD